MSRLLDEDEIRRLSRRIAAEFEATYGTLDEKVSRVPDEAASAIAKECDVPVEVARVAYRVMLDGAIPDHKPCCRLLMREFKRRADRGSPVPSIASYVRDVALTEGRWVEYLYGELGKLLIHEIRNLANLSRTVSEEIEPASERVVDIIRQRRKIVEAYFDSIIERWLKDHEAATIADAVRAITGGLLGAGQDSVDDTVNGARAGLLIKFRRYEQFLRAHQEEDSGATVRPGMRERILNDMARVIKEVQGPLERISRDTAGEILIEAMPPATESIDEKSKYGFAHPAFPAQARAGPPMQTPLDFLERDVWLAVMQPAATRGNFLRERIVATIDSLLDQGTPLDKMGTTIIFDLDSRFPWEKSKKAALRQELREMKETAGQDYRTRVEGYVLDNILAKIPQLRSRQPS
jgi:hypothetical protein